MGPLRVGEGESLGVVLMVMGLGLAMWVMAQTIVAVGAGVGREAATQPATGPVVTTKESVPAAGGVGADSGRMALPPEQLAAFVVATSLVPIFFMLGASAMTRDTGLRRLGLAPSQFATGVRQGVVAAVIAIPVVFLAAQLTDLVWRAIEYKHEGAHELLRVMGARRPDWVTAALVVGAVVLVPAFEELMFRGHLQTFFVHAPARVGRWLRGMREGQDRRATPPAAPTAAARWGGVILTSLCFAFVHVDTGSAGKFWMVPPIFVLSVCMGYAYERTGNLWVPIVVHAMFNGTSTALFFLFVK